MRRLLEAANFFIPVQLIEFYKHPNGLSVTIGSKLTFLLWPWGMPGKQTDMWLSSLEDKG